MPTATGSIAGRWLTIACRPRLGVAEVDVAVAPPRRAVRAAHVLGEDAPGLDPARDVHADVALQRRADVVRAHRGRDTDRGCLVAAARVERARDLALLVEDVAALLDRAGDQHVAVDAEEVLAVEAGVLHLLERADGLRFPDCHSSPGLAVVGCTVSLHLRSPPAAGAMRSTVRAWPKGVRAGGGSDPPRVQSLRGEAEAKLDPGGASPHARRLGCVLRRCGHTLRYFEELEEELPGACPHCDGRLRSRCPACAARIASAFQVECEECGATERGGPRPAAVACAGTGWRWSCGGAKRSPDALALDAEHRARRSARSGSR